MASMKATDSGTRANTSMATSASTTWAGATTNVSMPLDTTPTALVAAHTPTVITRQPSSMCRPNLRGRKGDASMRRRRSGSVILESTRPTQTTTEHMSV